ncbi:MAG: gamma-glutamyl-gamma-aminobutyrate hydrolase family protein [bacterium]|nr:gamma-glutamyl-gamma-aminobutyrate hydrolase family protein [bacterium]
MNVLVVNNGSTYLDKLIEIIPHSMVSLVRYDQLDPQMAYDYDVVVLSGGHDYSVMGHEAEYSKELQFIRQVKKPLLGICLGFELIAYAFGHKLEKKEIKKSGVVDIEVIVADDIFNDVNPIKVYDSHRWVLKEVSGKIVSLAQSKHGIEVIKHTEKMIYGFQFHPEMFIEETNGIKVFKNFFRMSHRVAV